MLIITIAFAVVFLLLLAAFIVRLYISKRKSAPEIIPLNKNPLFYFIVKYDEPLFTICAIKSNGSGYHDFFKVSTDFVTDIYSFTAADDDKTVAFINGDGSLELTDTFTGQSRNLDKSIKYSRVKLSRDGKVIAGRIAPYNIAVRVRKTVSSEGFTFDPRNMITLDFELSPTGRFIYILHQNIVTFRRSIMVAGGINGNFESQIEVDETAAALALSPDGNTLAILCQTITPYLVTYDTSDKQNLRLKAKYQFFDNHFSTDFLHWSIDGQNIFIHSISDHLYRFQLNNSLEIHPVQVLDKNQNSFLIYK